VEVVRNMPELDHLGHVLTIGACDAHVNAPTTARPSSRSRPAV
jgi:hypothetical protein